MAATSALERIDGLLEKIPVDGTTSKSKSNVSESDEKSGAEGVDYTAKHFHMDLNNLVFDAIDGELYTNKNIRRLHVPNDDSVKVVYRSDWSKERYNNKVAILSGGGSGHEPCFFGYVGYGMLTAAVCGEIFASPTTKSILYTILRISIDNNKTGVLLLIGNYTGDVLNFSLAMKIAKTQYNIPCKIVFLADDIAIPENIISNTGARGIAGQVLIHKIAGYYSEHGKTLDEIHAICHELNESCVGTVGIAASICHHFGNEYNFINDDMKSNILELGYGVHGEAGYKTIKFENIYKVIGHILKLFEKFLEKPVIATTTQGIIVSKKDENNKNEKIKRIVLLLNNLGSITNMEMLIIKKYLLDYMYYHYKDSIKIERFYSGKFETSLDMKGFSVTIMKNVTDELLKALDFDVPTIKAWPKSIETFEIDALKKCYFNPNDNTIQNSRMIDENTRQVLDLIASSNEEKSNENANKNLVMLSESQSDFFKKCIIACCNDIIANKELLNKLDKMVGDGDCGTTLEFGCKLILTAMSPKSYKKDEKLHCNSLVLTFNKISQLLSDMGGSSGALYGYLFIAASNQCSNEIKDVKNRLQLCNAFKGAISDLSDYSRAKLGDRTMLDALIPAINELIDLYRKDENDKAAIAQCAKAASKGCDETQNMVAKFGRSSYVSRNLQTKCVDPGAKAVSIWINSIAKVLAHE